MITSLLEKYKTELNEEIMTMDTLLKKTEGFSSATLDAIIRQALRKHLTEGHPFKMPKITKQIETLDRSSKEIITSTVVIRDEEIVQIPSFSTQLKVVLAEKEREKNQQEALPVEVQGMYS